MRIATLLPRVALLLLGSFGTAQLACAQDPVYQFQAQVGNFPASASAWSYYYEAAVREAWAACSPNQGVSCPFSGWKNKVIIDTSMYPNIGARGCADIQGGNSPVTFEWCGWAIGVILRNQGAIRDPDKNRGQQCGALQSNPINTSTGNKFQIETDLPAHGSSPLQFIRYYNSHLSTSQLPVALGSTLGPNWRSTYDRALRLVNPDFPVVYALRPDGKALAFRLSNGVFVSDGDVIDRLEKLTDASGALIGWRYTVGTSEEREIYDSQGRLTLISTRAGIEQSLVYDSSGKLSTVTDSFGKALTFGYDSTGRLASMTDPAGQQYTYGYGATDNVATVTYPDTRSKTYLYNESAHTSGASLPNALTGIVDEATNRYATFRYSANYLAISSEHAGGAGKHEFIYPATQPFTSVNVIDPLGQQRTFGVATVRSVGRVSGVNVAGALACGDTYSTTFDTNGNPSRKDDFNARSTTFIHDLTRNLQTSRTEAAFTPRARTITTQWLSTHRQPTQIDEPGRRTTYTHDANGNVLTKTILDTGTSESRTWSYTYNSFGQVLTADGPRTDAFDVTTYTYYSCTTGDECGQVHTITNALGHVTTYNTYNAYGQPLTITDPNGVETTLAYDPRQRLTSRTVGTEQTTFEYWPTGLLKKVTLPDSSYLEYTYDAAHRLTDLHDSEGNRIHYTLDAMGNRTREDVYDPTNTLTGTRTQVFSALNRLWKQIGAAGGANVTTTFGYDGKGNNTSIAAPLTRTTTQTYDELNRLKTVTDPLSGLTTYGYNALDQLISVSDPRSYITSYTHNALGDVKQQVSPDTGTTTNTYDVGGNLKTSTDARSKIATYDYDALNRVTSITYADQVIGYAYDTGTNQKGRLTELTDNSGSTTWSYDAQGRVLSRQQAMGSVTKSIGYTYDMSGRLQAITMPSGNVISYGYANGKVASLTLNGATTVLSSVLYYPFGPTTGWAWGNSTLAVREYDQDGKITVTDSAGLKTYSYDDAFRITGITDASNPALSQSYAYDRLDRLTSATGTNLNQSWTYDANGNRNGQGGSQVSTYTRSSTNNRLLAVSGAVARTYGYDNAGNVTSDGAATFTYNDAGRMISATKAGVTSTFALNGLGQRVRKTKSGASSYFVYDEAGHLIGEYDNAGALIAETIWFGDTPVALLKPDGSGGVDLFYIHTDHLNAPRRISRPSDNAIVWRWDSDPFGATAANENPSGLGAFAYNLRFPGQYFDSETGLHYNYFRDYDPSTGRYVQSDPIGLSGGLNTYAYAGSDPISLLDPLGLAPGDIFDSREAAEADRALYEPLVAEHNGLSLHLCSLLPGCGRGRLFLTDVYQVDSCRYTYELVEFVTGFPPGVNKKPGKLGVFKGRDALRRENNVARDAARQAGLSRDQARRLHDEISGQQMSFQDILRRAREIARGE